MSNFQYDTHVLLTESLLFTNSIISITILLGYTIYGYLPLKFKIYNGVFQFFGGNFFFLLSESLVLIFVLMYFGTMQYHLIIFYSDSVLAPKLYWVFPLKCNFYVFYWSVQPVSKYLSIQLSFNREYFQHRIQDPWTPMTSTDIGFLCRQPLHSG